MNRKKAFVAEKGLNQLLIFPQSVKLIVEADC